MIFFELMRLSISSISQSVDRRLKPKGANLPGLYKDHPEDSVLLSKQAMMLVLGRTVPASPAKCTPVTLKGNLAQRARLPTKSGSGTSVQYGRRWALAAASLATPEGNMMHGASPSSLTVSLKQFIGAQ
jgi:hypothetical protein